MNNIISIKVVLYTCFAAIAIVFVYQFWNLQASCNEAKNQLIKKSAPFGDQKLAEEKMNAICGASGSFVEAVTPSR